MDCLECTLVAIDMMMLVLKSFVQDIHFVTLINLVSMMFQMIIKKKVYRITLDISCIAYNFYKQGTEKL